MRTNTFYLTERSCSMSLDNSIVRKGMSIHIFLPKWFLDLKQPSAKMKYKKFFMKQFKKTRDKYIMAQWVGERLNSLINVAIFFKKSNCKLLINENSRVCMLPNLCIFI